MTRCRISIVPGFAGHVLCWLAVLLCSARGVAGAKTFTVATISDSGHGSLREAIDAANASGPGPHTIAFDLSRFGSGPYLLQPTVVYPQINTRVVIDGYTQPGARANSLEQGSNAVILIQIHGALTLPRPCLEPELQGWSDAALFTVGPGGAGSAIRGLAMTGALVPIALFSSNVSVDGNFFGLSANGSVSPASGNARAGVYVHGGPNRIGGDTPDLRNVFAGNAGASIIVATGDGNVIAGNYLGTDPGGTRYFPNRGITEVASPWGGTLRADILFARVGIAACFSQEVYGLDNFRSTGTVIGGYGRASGNVIASAIDACNVAVAGAAGHTVIAGNYLGTNWNGFNGIVKPNGQPFEQRCGVLTMAGDTLVEFNTIANSKTGIMTPPLGAPNVRNDFHANAMSRNSVMSIDLGNDGVTRNDAGDSDAGPNGLQNVPTKISASTVGIRAQLDSAKGITYRIDFYESAQCHTSGSGEGEQFVGSATATTDAAGHADVTFTRGFVTDRWVTATATSSAEGTSEFSACARVGPAAVATVLVSSSINPIRSHEKSGTVTVDVRGSAVTPSGRVYFTVDGGPPGVFTTLAAGSATIGFNPELFGWGNKKVTATYLGDAIYAQATSMPFLQTVYREQSDFDGDGLTDLLICEQAQNPRLLLSSQPGMGPQQIGGWPLSASIAGIGEFGGTAGARLLLHGPGYSVATLAGTTILGAGTVLGLPADHQIIGLGSFTGDLKEDIVSLDSANQPYHSLTGPAIAGIIAASPRKAGTPVTSDDRLDTLSDFNGDGYADLLWQKVMSGFVSESTIGFGGLITQTFLNFVDPLTGGSAVKPGHAVVATGDFNGDGKSDLVTREGGDWQILLLDGNRLVRRVTALGQMAADWQVAGTGYFTAMSPGAGMSGLVWRHGTTGEVRIWKNNGPNDAGDPSFHISTPVVAFTNPNWDLCRAFNVRFP